MRYSNNEEIKGIVKNGFDYEYQVWIVNYIIQNCGHNFDCNCKSRELLGKDIRIIKGDKK